MTVAALHSEARRENRTDKVSSYLEAIPATLLLDEALTTTAARVTLVSVDVYADRLEEARRRIPRDPRDAPTVALALTLECGIWTGDHDFFGCGVPVWVTETLLGHLEAREST
jgi:predicted nucleic acid-binding protein